jgi:large subunit ribosomal protein L30
MAQLKITWIKSTIGRPQNQQRVVDALGLKRLHHSVTHGDTPTIRGMVNKIQHLLSVEEIEETGQPAPRRTRRARTAAE